MNENIKDGRFIIKSGKIHVSDPCYEKEIWCAIDLSDVMNGVWRVDFNRKNGVITELRAELDFVEYHNQMEREAKRPIQSWYEFSTMIEQLSWNEYSDELCVDSGQMGIFDWACYPLIGAEDKIFYDTCGQITLHFPNVGIVTLHGESLGCVSSSGHGDGSYMCSIKKYENKIIGVKIVFIEDSDE